MTSYAAAAEKLGHNLDRFKGVNKSVLFAVAASLGAFVGSFFGYFISLAFPDGVLRVGVWDVFIGFGIGFCLVVVQNWHLQRLAVARRDILKAGLLAAAGGFLGGVSLVIVKMMSAVVFGIFGIIFIPHVLGWTAEGIVIGLFVSRAIPNLSAKSGLLAGLGSGFAGGVVTGFGLWVPLGDALKGVFIGLSIAIVEQLVKKAWIVVKRDLSRDGAPASRSLVMMESPPTLLLGEKPILVGSSSECQVFVKAEEGKPEVLGALTLTDNRILYEDKTTNRRQSLQAGSKLELADVTIEVHSKNE